MNTTDRAPVSVVIPCWRCSDTIDRAVASVAAQTLRPAEVILVDDASGDRTVETLHACAEKYAPGWIRVLVLPVNSGPGGARNAGLDCASQPWIAFLDADDAWHPQKIEIQYSWLLENPETQLCGHQTVLAPSTEFSPEKCGKPSAKHVTFKKMLIANRFPTRTVMMRRNLPYRFGDKNVTEDYLLWMEIVLDGLPSYTLDVPLAFSFRPDFSPGGYSGLLWRHEKRELAAWRILRKKGLISVSIFWIAVAWSLIKYVRRSLN